jgi:lipoprotein signal peptidase
MFFFVGIIINYNAQKATIISFRHILIAIIVLFILDQSIKVVVVRHQETVISIIDNWLLFKVYLHTGHFVNSIGIYIPIWFYIFIPVLPILLFRSSVFYKRNRYLLAISTILIYAGMLCFYTDKIVYGGSYDYLYLKQFSILDLKDIYLTIALFVYFQSFIYNQRLSALKKELCTDPLGLQYAQYEYHNIKRWLSHK